MFCKYCGTKIEKNNLFCKNCGNKNKRYINTNINDNSIIFGILAIIFFIIPFISIPLALFSIIISVEYKRKTEKKSSGLLLGIISIILSVLFWGIVIFAAIVYDDTETNNTNNNYQIEKYAFDIEEYNWISKDKKLKLEYDNYVIYNKNNEEIEKGTYSSIKGKYALNFLIKDLKMTGIDDLLTSNNINENYFFVLEFIDDKDEEEENPKYYYGIYDDVRKELYIGDLYTKDSYILKKEEFNNNQKEFKGSIA